MVVEDNEKLASSIVRGLEKNGYAVDCFHNGEEAFDHFVGNHDEYDAILLDLMLPGRSGTDICMSLRDRGLMTPIIILTARDEVADKVTLLNAGADDYMEKPFSFEELLARLRAVTRRPASTLQDELIYQSVRLIVSQRRAYVAEEPLTLTTKEFSILELFLRNQDTTLSREFILDHVWNYQFNASSNVVDAHVKNLRKKLADTAAGDIIETVSGVGYRLR